MEQKKTGQFIAELRKERELTQQELADKICVSNKTVSKWECGNGMPDISSIIPLCQVLNITVNELIAGERLTQDNYSQKADENMMHFMEKEEKQQKKSTFLFLLCMRFAVPFLQAFSILLNRKEFSEEQCFISYQAVKTARTVWLNTGILITVIYLSAMIPIEDDIGVMLEYLRYTFPLAISGFLYGMVGYLLLLPIQMKLEFVQHGFS